MPRPALLYKNVKSTVYMNIYHFVWCVPRAARDPETAHETRDRQTVEPWPRQPGKARQPGNSPAVDYKMNITHSSDSLKSQLSQV